MKVMVIVKATKGSKAGTMPTERQLSEMGKYNEELVKACVMLNGEGLHLSVKERRVRFTGEKRAVDGPFLETKELVAGFWLWQAKSMEEAVDWAKRCPSPMPGEESELELRHVFGAEEFGAEHTPDLQERDASLRTELEKRQKD